MRSLLTYVGRTPVFSSLKYSKTIAKILLASKEDGINRADALVVEALISSANAAHKFITLAELFVPIPSTSRSARRRGRNYMEHISQQLGGDQGISVRNILFHTRRVSDQSVLDAEARGKNLLGAMGIRNQGRRRPAVVLADDLLTTGSTMKEAIRTLEGGGFRVVAGITAFLA